MQASTSGAGQLFASANPALARERAALWAAVFDRFSRRRLVEAGVRRGARCLDAGAGSGSVAEWMAGQVGEAGQVTVADIDATQLSPHLLDHPRIRVVRHDISGDELSELAGADGFDVIHTRLVLSHLPARWAVVERLASMVAPGGALVVEELDGGWSRYVVETPDTSAYRWFAAYHESMTAVLEMAGKDVNWEVFTAMAQAGLRDIDAEMWTRAWRGGEPGCLLLRNTILLEQLRAKLLETGLSGEDLDRLGALLTDPRLVAYLHPAVSTIGRRPRRSSGRGRDHTAAATPAAPQLVANRTTTSGSGGPR